MCQSLSRLARCRLAGFLSIISPACLSSVYGFLSDGLHSWARLLWALVPNHSTAPAGLTSGVTPGSPCSLDSPELLRLGRATKPARTPCHTSTTPRIRSASFGPALCAASRLRYVCRQFLGHASRGHPKGRTSWQVRFASTRRTSAEKRRTCGHVDARVLTPLQWGGDSAPTRVPRR